jgi:GNAT superfamily N-acetyltransferase
MDKAKPHARRVNGYSFMSLTVRRAKAGDENRVAELAMKLVDQHVAYDGRRFARIATIDRMAWFYGEQTKVENASVLVAEKDGEIVGFAYMYFEPVFYAELATKVLWLHDIFVDASSRGSGAGKQLIEAVASEAKRFGANKVLLSVAAKNTAGRDFFEHAGFTTTMHEMMLIVGE